MAYENCILLSEDGSRGLNISRKCNCPNPFENCKYVGKRPTKEELKLFEEDKKQVREIGRSIP